MCLCCSSNSRYTGTVSLFYVWKPLALCSVGDTDGGIKGAINGAVPVGPKSTVSPNMQDLDPSLTHSVRERVLVFRTLLCFNC